MPLKTNRAAALIVASGDVLWDMRKVDRKASKQELETAAAREIHKGFQQLSRKQKQRIINCLVLGHRNGTDQGYSAAAR